jgi:cobalt/nickel transport system permease protein
VHPFAIAEPLRGGSSAIHQLDPRVKLVAALAFVFTVAILPHGAWLPYGLLYLASVGIAWRSGLGAAYALRRSFVALPFALAAITLLFTTPGPALVEVGGLTMSVPGTVRFVSVMVKSWVSVQMVVLLAATTAFPDLLGALRALRVPPPLLDIVAFMHRYLFVLGDEALRLRRARAARSAEGKSQRKGGGGLVWRGRVAGAMVGQLALRAFERSERVYGAMLSRGFQGELRIPALPFITDLDRHALVGWVTFLAMSALIGFVFAGG